MHLNKGSDHVRRGETLYLAVLQVSSKRDLALGQNRDIIVINLFITASSSIVQTSETFFFRFECEGYECLSTIK